jgi:hypothetical protein
MTPFNATNTDFMTDANCRHTKTDIFIDETQANLAKAQKICATCPVNKECLEYAIQLPTNTIGIYAGHTTRQLNKLRTNQHRPLIRHGSPSGYNKERDLGLPTCQLCRAANTRYHLERKQQRVTK